MATPDEAIDAIRETGGAQPGQRALHAKGKLYRGTFTATPEAARLSRAAHLGGTAVPALIRFSSGSGNPAQPDNAPGVR
ncbi:MAG TPA: catalase, partial [Mycobacterium sp.]|nr:catalase [Mycobacterium sp.]